MKREVQLTKTQSTVLQKPTEKIQTKSTAKTTDHGTICFKDIFLLKISRCCEESLLSPGVSKPILMTEKTCIPHLFSWAMLSLWKAACEPCIAWKHMWDEIGDRKKKIGDNTAHEALKQKSSEGICQEIKAQTSWRRADSDTQTCTVFPRPRGGGAQLKSKSTLLFSDFGLLLLFLALQQNGTT